MHLVAIAWLYVVLMMALAEALSDRGTVIGAVFTLLLYGVVPLGIVLYILDWPYRRRGRRAAEASADERDRRSHAGPGAVAPEREEG